MKISINNFKQSNLVYVIITFLLVYFSSNTLVTQNIFSTHASAYFILVFSLVIFCLYNGFKLSITRKAIIGVAYVLCSILITAVLNFDVNNFNGYILIMMKIFSALLLLKSLDLRRLMRAFSNVMCVLAISSLVVTYVFPLFSIEDMFPVVVNEAGIKFYNAILSFKIDAIGKFDIRNYGIFSEPAVYSFYLFIAGMFIYSSVRVSKKWCLMMCLIATTMASTCSPIGLISAIVFLFLVLYRVWNKVEYRSVIFVLMLYLIALICLIINVPDFIKAIMNTFQKTTVNSGTGSGRLHAIKLNLNMWLEHPLLGGGLRAITDVASILNFNTTTTGSLLSGFGMVFTVVITAIQFISTKLLLYKYNIFIIIVFFSLFMLQINNHAYIQGDWFWIFTMIGMVVKRDEASDNTM